MAEVAGRCWLVGDATPGRHSSAARFARLRGLDPRPCGDVESIPARVGEPTITAITASRLHRLPAGARQRLADLTGQGAALYVRGLPGPEERLDLAPFAQSTVTVARQSRAVAYRFTASRMLPAALAGERAADCVFDARGAEHLPPQAEELLTLRDADGNERAAIFALCYGKGRVIYDLHPEGEEEDGAQSPLVARLAAPQTCHQDVGALLAADCAINRDPQRLPLFNLTVDDRPVNFDPFNVGGLGALLRHVEEVCPGAHTDFAWTPWHSTPSHRYLDMMKKYATGFVWHGLYRHVDHRALAFPSAEFAKGRRLVGEIEARFGVRLQRIMIFPFEQSTPEQFRLLQEAGFLACVGEPGDLHTLDPHIPRYLQCSLPAVNDPSCGFTFLYRYRVATLTRARMLAMAALGLPIIAYAHPDELGLRRLSCVWEPRGDLSHFDPVLRFAAAKGLPSRSLEEIAFEVKAAGTQYSS